MAELSREGHAVDRREVALSEALAAHRTESNGLRVYALGPLRAEIDGEPIRRWGGAKAGSRQAEAIFAFLFDRGERGASKDEIVELVWPDVDMDRADAAFHRTMLGLRSALEPGRASRAGGPIAFGNDRYKLESDVVAWSDVAAFEELLRGARAASDAGERVPLLETARALYRADAFDDCPFYGDSVFVEERREYLRGRSQDLLVELGDQYAGVGDTATAAARYRQALSVNPDDLRAQAGLERLGAVRAAG
jgi:two-component SAPR family response regulator